MEWGGRSLQPNLAGLGWRLRARDSFAGMAPGCSLDRRAPVCSLAVEGFVRDKHYEAHRRKVTSSRTLVNNDWSHIEEWRLQSRRRNVKREQLNEDRAIGIERENQRLLLRFHEIDQRGPMKTAAGMMLGSVSTSRGQSQPAARAGTGSNVGARTKEMRRIDEENQRLLRKLQGAKSTINLAKIKKEAEVKEYRMRSRCEYQKPEWRESPAILEHAASEPRLTPRAYQGLDDAEVLRLAREEMLQADADQEEPATMEAEEPTEAVALAAPAPRSYADRSSFGGHIPEASRRLVDELMDWAPEQDDDAMDPMPAVLRVRTPAEQAPNTEEDYSVAKEAAAQAFRAAHAIDVGDSEDLHYNDLIKRGGGPQRTLWKP